MVTPDPLQVAAALTDAVELIAETFIQACGVPREALVEAFQRAEKASMDRLSGQVGSAIMGSVALNLSRALKPVGGETVN